MERNIAEADPRCSLCGRQITEPGLSILEAAICPVCERISVVLKPQHPLYPFWVMLVRASLEERDER